MSNSALAKIDLPDGPVGSITEVRNALNRISGQCNLITAMAAPDFIPPMHRVSFRMVVVDHAVDSRGSGSDCYRSTLFCKDNERALSKIGLLKILEAAGGSLVDTRRTDDRSDPHYCEWSVAIRLPTLDGKTREFRATKEVDYRQGSTQLHGMKDGQIRGARAHIVSHAESKALNRAIRGGLSLKQKYTIAELDRPFIVPALVQDLDVSDPEIKRMMVSQMLGARGALYGNDPEPQPALLAGAAADGDDFDGPVIDVSGMAEDDDGAPDSGGADPWDEPGASATGTAPTVFPIDLDQVPRNDPDRYEWLGRLNVIWEELVGAVGHDQAAAIAAPHLPEGSPVSWPLDESVASLGQAMKNAARGAA
jgi:hypothetical protein